MELREFKQTLFKDFQRLPQTNAGNIDELIEKFSTRRGVNTELYCLFPIVPSTMGIQPSFGAEMAEFSLQFAVDTAKHYGARKRRRNWCSLAAVNFDLVGNYKFEIAEFATNSSYPALIEQHLAPISWENMLLHVVTAFARSHSISEVTIPAHYRTIAEMNHLEPVSLYVKRL